MFVPIPDVFKGRLALGYIDTTFSDTQASQQSIIHMAHAEPSPGSRILRFSPRALTLKTSEPRKVPITASRWKALGYDSIHILPATVALYLMVVNLSGYYIGEHLVKNDLDGLYDGIVLAIIQVFAKIQVRVNAILLVRQG